MSGTATTSPHSLKDLIMRFAPAVIALSTILAITGSVSLGAEPVPNPRAAVLVADGKSALEAGEAQRAIDAFEAALVVDPDYSPIFVLLGDAARQDGLTGKAIRYYRETLARDPDSFAALAGEGAALVEKGALEKARLNLAKLESLCGLRCAQAEELRTALAAGPKQRVLTAEAVMPDAQVTQN